MHNETLNHISRRIVRQAEALGADLAGIAAVKDVKHSPSHRISPRMPRFEGVGTKPVDGQPPGIVQWPQGANSAVVIAIAHPVDRPELDWWVTGASSGNTEGNRRLMAVVEKLADWLVQEMSIRSFKLPYHVEHGGIYMKDAAVLAGLGCIGRNNLLISPQYGTRLRLRVMLIDADLPATGPVDFDPCADCSGPCRKACPQKAFDRPRYSAEAYGQSELPGRSGVFDRWACNRQMEQDNADYETVTLAGEPAPARRVRYCRRCELTCPAGRPLRAK
jgi:epoxyqueuosine reductase